MKIRYCFLLLLCASLVACGFHLRGKTKLPPQLQRIYIESLHPYAEFEQHLRRYLRDNGANLVDSASDANAIIKLSSTDIRQTSTGISANSQTREYTLSLNVTFEIILANGRTLPKQSVSSKRQYTSSVNQMLSNDLQSERLQANMYDEAAYFLTNRLASEQTRQALEKQQ